jgi:hypothetical protein
VVGNRMGEYLVIALCLLLPAPFRLGEVNASIRRVACHLNTFPVKPLKELGNYIVDFS